MTQYVINIGAIPNDGTGDPLRTAFNETNLNFNQVFAAGPVLSNIQIANNKILTTNTNGNLILAPNGTGIIQANVSIVPNLANLRNLGSTTNRWNTVYTQYVDVSGPVSLSQLTVTGNLTVNGNIIQIGNLVTDAKTIQLANTASTANAANGSGITVGANDNIATILYNSTGNTWTTNIGLSSVGNITAPYFVGNGSQLTGISTASTGNLDIVGTVIEIAAGAPETLISISPDAEGWAFLQLPNDATANTANTRLWNGAGNVEIGSGDLSNSGPSYTWIFDNAGNLTVPANSSINTSPGSNGNINFHPDGSGTVNITGASPILLRLVGDEPNTLNRIEIDTYGNSNILGGTFTGVFYRGTPDAPDVVQSGDRLASLRGKGYNGSTFANVSGLISIDAQGTWSNVSNGTHISFWTTPNNSNIIQESARLYAGGDYHQIIGNIVVDAGNISASGNVTGNYFIGNGSQFGQWIFSQANLTVPTNGNIITSPGSDGNINFHPDGNGTVNITGASPILLRLVGDEPNTLNRIEIDTYGNSNQLGGTFTGVFYRGTPDTPEVVQSGDRLASLKGKGYNGSTIANVSGQITIDAQGTWSNVSNGTHISFWTTPNNSNVMQESARMYAAGDYHQIIGNIVVEAGFISASGNVTGNYFIGNGSQLTGLSTSSISNGTSNVLIATANGNATITVDSSSTWNFDSTGNLTLPNGGSINFNAGGIVQAVDEDFSIRVQDADDDGFALLQEVDDGAGTVLGLTQLQRDRFVVEFAGGGAPQFTFNENGEFSVPGNIRTTEYIDSSLYAVSDNSENGSVELKVISYAGDVLGSNVRVTQSNATISTGNALHTWLFDLNGNLTLPLSGNLVGSTPNNNGYINWFGNSSGDLNGYTTMRLVPDDTLVNNDQYLILDPTSPGHIHLRAGGTQDNSGAMLFLGGENSHFKVNSGSNPSLEATANNYSWTFGTDGTFTLPGDANNTQNSQITSVGNSSGDGNGYATLQLKPDSNVGGDSYLIIDPTAPNHIHIRAGGAQDNSGAQLFLGGENSYFLVENGANSNVYVASNSNQWKFDTTGILTLPGEGVLQSLNDTVTLLSLNTTTGNANSVYLGTSGGLGFNDQAIGGNWLEIFRSGSDPEIRVPPGGGNILIAGASGSGGAGGRDITITAGPADQTNYYTTAGGTVNIVGGLGATDDGGGGGPGGNINLTAGVSADPAGRAGNVNITCGPNSWVFDYSGNVTIPGNINAVLSSPAPSLNGFGSVNAVTVNASGNISGNTAGYAIGYRDIPQVSFTGNATIVTTDAGKHYYSTQSSNFTLTIANNASQGFQVGAAITVVNQGTGNITVAQGSGVTLYLAGNATSGNRTVATFGMATIIKVATDIWFINGTGVS